MSAPTAECDVRAQSLADGAAGIALLQIELLHHGFGSPENVHALMSAAAHGSVAAADDAGLYYGLPALAFALHAAERVLPGRYSKTLAAVDASVTRLVHRRVDLATARIRRGDAADLAEFDLIYGLTGIGAHLLRNRSGDDALERVLTYLVCLTARPAAYTIGGRIVARRTQPRRQRPPRTSLQRGQAHVGGDPVQPGPYGRAVRSYRSRAFHARSIVSCTRSWRRGTSPASGSSTPPVTPVGSNSTCPSWRAPTPCSTRRVSMGEGRLAVGPRL